MFVTLGLLWTTLFLSQLTYLIYPDLASIIYVAYVQSDALFPCLYLSLLVHAFVCSRIDYCNSLLIGLPKSRLAPLSVLNAAARLIARIPRFSHISTFMTEQLHWLPQTNYAATLYNL